MEKKYAKYMRYGKQVVDKKTGMAYELIEDVGFRLAGKVKAVKAENTYRWSLTGNWIRSWQTNMDFRNRFTDDIEECKKVHLSYEEFLDIEDIQPANRVRFINVDYTLKFMVNDLDEVIINGEKARVYYIDNYHFGFVSEGANKSEWRGAYHICEFAELCAKGNIKVEPAV